MTDETILFNISDGGTTETLSQLLIALGQNGGAAIERLEAAMPAYANEARAAADIQQLLNTYIAAGGDAVGILTDALANLTETELLEATASDKVTIALQNMGVAAQVAASRVAEAGQTMAGAFEVATVKAQQFTDLLVQLAIEEEAAASAAVDAAHEIAIADNEAFDQRAKNARTLTDIKVQAALEEEAAVSAATAERQKILQAETAAYAEAARLEAAERAESAQAAMEAARTEATAINAAKDQEIASAMSATAAMNAATRQWVDVSVQAALEDEAAFSASQRKKADEARIASDLAVQAAIEEELARSNADAKAAETASAAAAERASIQKAETEAYIVRKQMEADAAIAASRAETEAAVAASRAEIEAAHAQANVINATRDTQIAAAESARAANAKSAGGLFGMVVQLTGVFTAMKAIKDIDAFETLEQKISVVSKSSAEASTTFDKLIQVANNAQTPIEVVANTFSQFRASMDATKYSTEDVITATNVVTELLRGTGATAQQTARIMHDLSEGMGTGALQGRQLNSVFQQNSIFAEKLGEVLGVNLHQYQAHTAAVKNNQAEIDRLSATLGNGLPTSYATAENAVKTHTKGLQDANKAYLDGKDTATQYLSAVGKEGAALSKSAGEAATAKEAQDKVTHAKIDALKASRDHSAGLASETLATALLSAKAQATAAAINSAYGGTVAGAFTVLNNTFIQFIGNSGQANLAVNAFKAVLLTLAANLNVLVPLVEAVGVAFIGWKMTQATQALTALATSEKAVAAATTVMNLALTPEIAAFAAVALIVGTVLLKMGALNPIVDKAKELWGALTQNTVKQTAALAEDTTALDKDTAAQIANNNAKKQSAALNTQYGREVSSLGADTATSNVLNPQFGGDYAGGGNAKVTGDYYDGMTAANSNTGYAAQRADLGGSRNGSSFTVPGGGGVDSRTIAVSPGEHVTVQTPSQARAGTVNPTTPVGGRFRDGGVYVNLGGVTATYANGTGSIAGYTADDGTGFSSAGDQTGGAAVGGAKAPAITVVVDSPSAAAAVASASAKKGSGRVTYTVSADGSTLTASDGSSASNNNDPYANVGTSTQAASKAKQIAADLAAVNAAEAVTSIGGVSIPTGGPNAGITKQQAKLFYYVTGQGWQARPGVSGAEQGGNAASAYKTYRDDMAKPVTAFREGGSFVVPGGSGVDSRMIQMLTSPGEEVTVKTPAQQRETNNTKTPQGAALANRGQTIIMNVTTDNADTFRKSTSQIASDTKRKLARVS